MEMEIEMEEDEEVVVEEEEDLSTLDHSPDSFISSCNPAPSFCQQTTINTKWLELLELAEKIVVVTLLSNRRYNLA